MGKGKEKNIGKLIFLSKFNNDILNILGIVILS